MGGLVLWRAAQSSEGGPAGAWGLRRTTRLQYCRAGGRGSGPGRGTLACPLRATGEQATESARRVIIFTNLRSSVARIVQHLEPHSALIKPRIFVGQGVDKKKGQVGAGLGAGGLGGLGRGRRSSLALSLSRGGRGGRVPCAVSWRLAGQGELLHSAGC
jgi:hypothetical protein